MTSPAGLTSALPLVTLAAGLTGADDLLALPDGVDGTGDRLLVGSLTTGHIAELGGPDGATRLPVTLPGVEGLVWLNGTLYAADQPRDRVVRIGSDGSVHTVLQLPPVPGLEGVDDIGSDGTHLLVPDSPRGQLLVIDPTGRVLRTLSGFDRPTGVWPLPGGALLVSDENAGTVVRVAANGSRTVLAHNLPGADDVVAGPDGTVWSIGINGGVLVRLAGGRAEPVVSGFAHPQGLAVDGAGNLIVADLGTGTVTKVVTSFALPPSHRVTLGAGQPLCVSVLRAPGFTGAVTLSAGSGARVLSQPGPGSVGVVLPSACAGSCTVVVRATSGSLKVSAALGYRTG